MLAILKADMDVALALIGHNSIADVDRSALYQLGRARRVLNGHGGAAVTKTAAHACSSPQALIRPCGSSTNFLAAPLSKSS